MNWFYPSVLSLTLLVFTACNSPAIPAVLVAENQVTPAAILSTPTPAVSPTPTLPPIPIDQIVGQGGAYPPPAAQAEVLPTAYPGKGLPAPVIVQTQVVPLKPTNIPTVDLPTVTPLPSATAAPPGLPNVPAEEHFWFQRPVPEGGVVWTDKYYPYGGTQNGMLRPHHGVEFNVPKDTPVLAAADGEVVFAGADNKTMVGPEPDFYGNVVIIRHDFTYLGQAVYTLYAHLGTIYVTAGQRLKALDMIALSGASGVADGAHLHFEVRVGENNYESTRNPVLWIYPFPDRGAIAGRVVNSTGEFIPLVTVILRRIDGGGQYGANTWTYAGETLNSDDQWQENFAFDDIPPGQYEVEVKIDEKKYKAQFNVNPYRTSTVEIVIP